MLEERENSFTILPKSLPYTSFTACLFTPTLLLDTENLIRYCILTCQSLSQSSGIGKAPAQAPITVSHDTILTQSDSDSLIYLYKIEVHAFYKSANSQNIIN